MGKGRRKRATAASVAVESAPEAPPWRISLLVGVGVLAFLVYANSLGNGFVWDDPIILERQLVVFNSLSDVLITPRGIPNYSPDYYRPTTTLSYLIDRSFGGDEPFVFHLSVVLAHCAASVLVALLGAQLLGWGASAWIAGCVAGALFAVHPVHTESVAWAAGRSDVLATVFVLAALLLIGARRMSPRLIVLSGLAAFAALGAKEVALGLYPLAVVRDVLDPKRKVDGRVREYAGLLVALVTYFLLRWVTIGEVIGQQPGEASAASALPSVFWALGGYVRELLWPLPLNAYIDVVPSGVLPVLAIIALLAGGLWSILRLGRGEWWWLFSSLWVLVALFPSLAILWKIPEVPMAERYLYLPSVGFCLAVSFGACHWAGGSTRKLAAVVVPLLLLAGIVTLQRNPVWRDDIRLWEATKEEVVVSGMAWRSLGAAYLNAGRDEDARIALERALTFQNPPLGLQGIYSNLGTIEMRTKNFAGARDLYAKALVSNPNAADSLFNLGLSIFYGGEQSAAAAESALPHFLRAAELSPYDPDIDAVLGQIYAIRGESDNARRFLQAALDKGLRRETRVGIERLLAGLEN